MEERATTPPSPRGHELIPLESCVGRDAAEVGRKAAVLAWAAAEGLQIPKGLVLPARWFWAALEVCGVGEQAQYLAASALRLDPRHTLDLAAAVHAAIKGAAVTALARDHAEAAFARLSTDRLVCRSSSALEDGRTAAFPGVFVSRLNLTSVDDLAEAMVACWRSAFSPMAIQYLLRLGSEPIDLSLALLIQPQVAAQWYGLYVSVDPVSGDATPIVELTGAGPDALVGGARPAVRGRQTAAGWQLDPAAPSLLPALARVSAMASRLSVHVPGPLDIEFALRSVDAEPVLLQCRPIAPMRAPRGSVPASGYGHRIIGRPCAGGHATGLVVARGEESPTDEPGIALVESLSTDDYDLIFRHAGVIATQELSALSHPAILCRELGVPFICGAGPEAMRFVGSWVMLDGKSGVAEVLPGRPAASAQSAPQERVLYLTDVERILLRELSGASEPGGVARRLGVRDLRVLPVPLTSIETQQLASLAEQPAEG